MFITFFACEALCKATETRQRRQSRLRGDQGFLKATGVHSQHQIPLRSSAVSCKSGENGKIRRRRAIENEARLKHTGNKGLLAVFVSLLN